MTLSAGSRLGPYEILAPIGAGGMGEVYRARDTKLDRDVAVKVLPEEFFEDRDRVARFEREAKALASLNHPGIAAVHSFEAVEGRHILVMELLEGEGLDARIARGAIPFDEALPIARQIAEALEAAHERAPYNAGASTFSPDGHSLAYVSDESGRFEVYVRPYPGPGGRVQVSTGGGIEPLWSPNGRELFFRNGDDFLAVEIAKGAILEGGRPRVLFSRRNPPGGSGIRYDVNAQYAVSPDGQRFLMSKPDAVKGPGPVPRLVVNWFEELKQRATGLEKK